MEVFAVVQFFGINDKSINVFEYNNVYCVVLGVCESLSLLLLQHGVELVREVGEHVPDVVEHVAGLGGGRRRGLVVARRQPRQRRQPRAPVVPRVRPPADLAAVLLYGARVLVRERNAIRFCAGARL